MLLNSQISQTTLSQTPHLSYSKEYLFPPSIRKISQRQAIFYLAILTLNLIALNLNIFVYTCLKEGKSTKTNIEKDLHLTETEFGILAGTSYTLICAFALLIHGYISDRVKYRTKLIFFCTFIGFLCSSISFFATKLWHLLLIRVICALLISCQMPNAISIISDLFQYKNLCKANSFYLFGQFFAVSICSLTIFIDDSIGWRYTLLIISIFGILSSLLILLIKEPPRRKMHLSITNSQDIIYTQDSQNNLLFNFKIQNLENQDEKELSLKDNLKIIFSNQCLIFIVIAMFFRVFSGGIVGFWTTSFYQIKFPNYIQQFSILVATVGLLTLAIGQLFAGYASDKFEQRYPKAKGYLTAGGILLNMPFLAICYIFAANFYVSLFSLFASNLFGCFWEVCAFTMLTKMFSSNQLGQVNSILAFAISIASAVGSYVIGYLSDIFDINNHPKAQGNLIGICVNIGYLITIPLVIIAGRIYAKRYLKPIKIQSNIFAKVEQ